VDRLLSLQAESAFNRARTAPVRRSGNDLHPGAIRADELPRRGDAYVDVVCVADDARRRVVNLVRVGEVKRGVERRGIRRTRLLKYCF